MMTEKPAMAIDPWAIRETDLRVGALAQMESVFALSNGHIGMRGTLDEGEPIGVPGTFLNGFHEVWPLPYAESAYGNPEAGETVVNVTNGKLIRLLVDDELLDARYGELVEHERVLDFREGVLRRRMRWKSPTGHEVIVSSQRMVSLAQRGVAAILYEVEPVDRSMQLVVQSELVANAEDPAMAPIPEVDDPRAAVKLDSPLIAEEHFMHDEMAMLVHRTQTSGLRIAAAMDHEVEGPEGTHIEGEIGQDIARLTVTAKVEPGEKLRVLKFLSYGWSGRRSLASVRAQARGTLSEARHTGWEGLLEAQREYLKDFWDNADVTVDGDEELQQAVRFGLFSLLQASARGERRAIPAKGLTGSGYDGHAFWDTETFALPVLSYTLPDAARDALYWRFATLDLARERAHQLGLQGAAFPWRTIAGRECSGYWPASTAAFHVSADVSDAVIRYVRATDNVEFEQEVGVPILVETARLWISLGSYDQQGEFRIAGVTGPDEYSSIADNNVYTNLMAARNLLAAADVVDRHPEAAAELNVEAEEPALWRTAAEKMHIPYDEDRGVHPQADNFTHHELWPFEEMTVDDYPLLLHFPYFDLYRKQVVKQADLVMALYTNGDYFTDEQKARNFAYYEAITVRDSSLSAATQAIVAAETGHLHLAYEYLQETAYVDLHNLAHNTSDGLHLAACAGGWMGLVAGFGGFRDYYEHPCFAPRLPEQLSHLSFKLRIRESTLKVDISKTEVTYTLERGDGLRIEHYGEELAVVPNEPVTLQLPEIPTPEPVKQPKGRAPSEVKPSRLPLDETGVPVSTDGQYAHQSGTNV